MSNYIKKVEVVGLWGEFSFVWNLNHDVNILSGLNGSGKSTILRAMVQKLRLHKLSDEIRARLDDVIITFDDGETISNCECKKPANIKIDIISTFDSKLKESDTLKMLSDGAIRTELDWDIYRMQKRYMSYQLEQGRRIISLLTSKAEQSEIAAITAHETLFWDIIDSLFENTNKKIDRESDELAFRTRKGTLSPYLLSSGEKQVLLILATALTQNNAPTIMVMDEPEISLHFDWQCRLIEDIRKLNPCVQIIASTHSPAMVMNGWMGHVSEISELITNGGE